MRSTRPPVLLVVAALSSWPLPAQSTSPTAAERVASGRVVDQDGAPVAGAAVHVQMQGAFLDTAAVLATPTTTTDVEGRYRVAAPNEQYLQVIVAAQGRQVCALRLAPGAPKVTMPDALMLNGASLRGRIRGPDGAPLPGARVRVENAIADYHIATMWFASGAVTDAKGIFVAPGVPTTGLRVTVTAQGHRTRSLLAAHHSPLDLTLEHIGVVRGRVVDEDGAPLAGISLYGVTVETRDGDHEPILSDAEGRFTLTVPKQGRFRVAGSERVPPYRSFSSDLLHGPADDVLISPRASPTPPLLVTVRCIDAATNVAIPTFHASWQVATADQAQMALLQHWTGRREYRETAQFRIADATAPERGAIVVDAPGHAFAIAPVPSEGDAPLVLALEAESFVIGRVLDAETGQPMAGVAVRALPWGNAMGGGGDPRLCGVLTDAAGRYRIQGLRAGSYSVQAYGEDRPASKVYGVLVGAAAEAALDLEVPKRRWLELSLLGDVPAGLACQLSCQAYFDSRSVAGFTSPMATSSFTVPLGQERALKLGPAGDGPVHVQIWKPSRVRVGAGTNFEFPTIQPTDGATEIRLPDLRSVLARGRVQLTAEVARERIAILAHPVVERRGRDALLSRPHPHVAALDADAGFVLDLPVGGYVFQLVDLETGIVFHTEGEPRQVAADPAPIELKPPLHFLEIELVSTQADGEVVLRSIAVDLRTPGVGSCRAFLRAGGRSNDVEHGDVPFRIGATRQRWLVPPGQITVSAVQTFEVLLPWSQGYSGRKVDGDTIQIDQPVHRVRLSIPPPPSDPELLRGDGK